MEFIEDDDTCDRILQVEKQIEILQEREWRRDEDHTMGRSTGCAREKILLTGRESVMRGRTMECTQQMTGRDNWQVKELTDEPKESSRLSQPSC